MNEDNLQKNASSIIAVNEIKNILRDFRIGKKPLAKLLGWGETTIIRYMDGDIPTSEYSNRLRAIADDPSYYYELLLKNKDNLTSVAFKKSKSAVLEKLMESKINLVAQYIINKSDGELSPRYIQWFLYYSQAFSLSLFDKELFDDDYLVNTNNIPYLKIYDSMRNHGLNVLEIPEDKLRPEEINLINKVMKCFAWYGPRALKALFSFERTVFRVSRDKENNKIVTKETIKNYFKDVASQYHIHNLDEIYLYSDKQISELRNI